MDEEDEEVDQMPGIMEDNADLDEEDDIAGNPLAIVPMLLDFAAEPLGGLSADDINYNLDLAGAHQYLGDDLTPLSRPLLARQESKPPKLRRSSINSSQAIRSPLNSEEDHLQVLVDSVFPEEDEEEEDGWNLICKEDQLFDMIVVKIPGVILLPWGTLPINNVTFACRDSILECRRLNHCIGVMAQVEVESNNEGDLHASYDNCLGVVAEISAIQEAPSDVESARRDVSNLKAILIGRQRFQVVSHRVENRIIRARVKLLSEASDKLGVLPFTSQLPNIYKCSLPSISYQDYSSPTLRPVHSDIHLYFGLGFTSCSIRILEHIDARNLCSQIRHKLLIQNDSWRLVEMDFEGCERAIKFSYWLIFNLLLPDEWICRLLAIDHVVHRLLVALSILDKPLPYQCNRCGRQITRHRDLVCLAKEGPVQTFVNPHGNHFDMITTRVATNTIIHGPFVSQDSWFPGYSWRMMMCTCFTHLGWMFKATTDKMLVPQYFYGVVRNNVQVQLDESEIVFS